MTTATVVSMPDQVYLARLRALGAWWCLGSSALEPRLLMQYAPAAASFVPRYSLDELGVATGQGLKKVDESCRDVVVLVNVAA